MDLCRSTNWIPAHASFLLRPCMHQPKPSAQSAADKRLTESKQCRGPSEAVPAQETGRLPLGFLFTRLYELYCRHHRYTSTKRTRTASSRAYGLHDQLQKRTESHQDG